MVNAGERTAKTMDEFSAISVERYGGSGGEQLQELGENIHSDMKKVWANPLVGTVGALEKLEPLISPLIRQHYADVAVGGRGFRGHGRDVGDIGALRWDWQFMLPSPGGGDVSRRLPVRGMGGFFSDHHMELGEPCLWIFDCRRGNGEGKDKAWEDVDYTNAMEWLQRSMANVYKWTAIFLFPPGVYLEDGLRNALHIPEESTSLKGVWVFQSGSTNGHEHDLRHEGRVERAVQAIGDVAIVLAHPIGGRASQNVPRGMQELPTVFMDCWSEARAPCIADRHEKKPRS